MIKANSVVVTTGGGFLRLGLNALSAFLMARFLGLEGFGVTATALAVYGILVPVGAAGLDRAGVRFAPESIAEDNRPQANADFLASIGTSAVFATLLAILVRVFAQTLGSESELATLIGILWLALPSWSVVVVAAGHLNGHSRFELQQLVLSSRAVFLIGAVCWSWSRQDDPQSLASAITVGALASAALAGLVLFAVSKNVGFNWDSVADRLKRSTRYGAPLILSSVLSIAVVSIDLIMVNLVAGDAESGTYAVGSRLYTFATVGYASLVIVVSPRIVKLWHQKRDVGQITDLFSEIAGTASMVSLATIVPLWVFVDPILTLLGPEFPTAKWTFLVLLTGLVGNILTGPVYKLLELMDRQQLVLKLIGVVLAGDVVLNLVLINLFGAIGAAVSTVTATTLSFVFASLVVKRETGILSISSTAIKYVLVVSLVVAGVVISTESGALPRWSVVLVGVVALVLSVQMLRRDRLA